MVSIMGIIKQLIEAVFSPLGIVSLLTAVGVILWYVKKFSYLARRMLLWAGILFLIFFFSPLSKYLILGLERPFQPLLFPPESRKIQRIVVLAGYAEELPGFPITSSISKQTIYSISEGLRLYRLLPGSKLIVSGGMAPGGEKSVAASMSDFLQQTGVPVEDIIVEGVSRNTYENLVEVGKLVGTDSFILVASACDLKRVMAVAHKLNMDPIPAPSWIWTLQHHPPDMSLSDWLADFFISFAYPSTDNLFRLQWAYHEYVGYAWYKLLGRI